MFELKFVERFKDKMVRYEFEALVAELREFIRTSFNEDGTIRTEINNDGDGPTSNTFVNNLGQTINIGGMEDEQWWRKGPWTFDDPNGPKKNYVILLPPSTPTGTYDDYAPPGIDDAVGMTITPTGDITITGIKRSPKNRKRMIILRNSSAFTVTLTHNDASSQVGNRFSLPGGTDVELTDNQNIWLYYDLDIQSWTCAITAQAAGGMGVGGPAAGSGTTLESEQITLTDAQIKAGTDVLIATVPAGKTATVIGLILHWNFAVGYNTSRSVTVRYNGITQDLTVTNTAVSTIVEESWNWNAPSSTSRHSTTDGTDLYIHFGGVVTGGDAANYMNAKVIYALFDTP